MPVEYNFVKDNADITKMSYEINSDTVISGTLLYINFMEPLTGPSELDIFFDNAIGFNEETQLSGIVFLHNGSIPLTIDQYCESGDVSYYLDDSTIVDDPYTNVSGSFIPMQVLVHRRELYNDSDNPLYVEGYKPLLGVSGTLNDIQSDISSINTSIGKNGWYTQYIKSWTYPNPSDLLIYYGWLNSFNSSDNGWNNEKVSQDMAKYNYLVFGDGIQDSGHGDYSNTQTIIPRIKSLNQNSIIFGYVSANQNINDFKSKVDQWNTLQVDGIFVDEAGYDYGTTTTNSRLAFNERIDYIHNQTYSNLCFANAWNTDNVIGIVNDASYPNTTWNSTLIESSLTSNDWLLLESFPVNTLYYTTTSGYCAQNDWASKGLKATNHRYNYGINIAAVGVINNDNLMGQDLFNFGFVSAMTWNFECFGTSDDYYAASSASVRHWDRPITEGLGREWGISPSVQLDNVDTDRYIRYLDFGRLIMDFSESAQISKIEKFTPDESRIIKFGPGNLSEGSTPCPALTTASGSPVTGLAFDDTTKEFSYGSFKIPNKWKRGTNINVDVYFFNNYSQDGDKSCVWCLEYQSFEDLESITSKSNTSITAQYDLPTDVGDDTFIHTSTIMDCNDVDNPINRNDVIPFKIYRDTSDSNDTMVNDAILIAITFEFLVEEI